MKLIEFRQDHANPIKWMAKYQIPGAKKAKKVYVMAATREEALATLNLHEQEIETQEVVTLDYRQTEPEVREGDLEDPKPSRWERFKYWLVYG